VINNNTAEIPEKIQAKVTKARAAKILLQEPVVSSPVCEHDTL